MVIFLCGPDSYHRQKKTKEIIAQYRQKHSSLALEKFDLAEKNQWPAFKNFIGARSLFDDVKMAVAGNFLEAAEESDFLKILKSLVVANNFHVLASANNIPKNKNYQFLLEKPVLCEKFTLVIGARWQKFIKQEIINRQLRLKSSTIEALANSYEGDCFGLFNELDKLALTNQPEKVISQWLPSDFFGSLQRLARGTIATQLPFLEKLLAQEDPAKIFNLLAYNVSPANQEKFADYDAVIKAGKLDYPEAMLSFLLE